MKVQKIGGPKVDGRCDAHEGYACHMGNDENTRSVIIVAESKQEAARIARILVPDSRISAKRCKRVWVTKPKA